MRKNLLIIGTICLLTVLLISGVIFYPRPIPPTIKPIIETETIETESGSHMLPKPDELLTESGSKLSQTLHYVTAKTHGQKIIALTFDDGPNPINTPVVLDLLKARQIKASFFVLGSRASQYPEIVKRIVAEGHDIGNHSWNHPDLTKLKQADLDHQILDTQKTLTTILGFTPYLFRPPYGAMNQKVLDTANLPIILWSDDSLDWKDHKAEDIKKVIMSTIKPGKIILLHDIHATTVQALPTILDALTKAGYKFVTISELFQLSSDTSKTAKTIYH